MDISLTPEMEQLVREKVASGMYDSPSHVVDAGLMMLDQEERYPIENVAEAREKIKRGMEQLAAGEVVTDAELRVKLEKRRLRRRARRSSMCSASRRIWSRFPST